MFMSWDNLKSSTNNFIDGEVQVSNGLSALINNELNPEYFQSISHNFLPSSNMFPQ